MSVKSPPLIQPADKTSFVSSKSVNSSGIRPVVSVNSEISVGIVPSKLIIGFAGSVESTSISSPATTLSSSPLKS